MKFLEDKGQTVKIRETLTFTATRALFLGFLGAAAAFVGGAFLSLQKALWILLGTAYAVLGLLYLARRTGTLMFELGFGRWLLVQPALGELSPASIAAWIESTGPRAPAASVAHTPVPFPAGLLLRSWRYSRPGPTSTTGSGPASSSRPSLALTSASC